MDEKKIPVIKKNDMSVYWINPEDIRFAFIEAREIVYYTKDDVFYHMKNLEELFIALRPEGFEKLDRGNLVQMDKITYYDSEYGKVYFDEIVDSHSIYATVSNSYLKKVEKQLGKEKDIRKDSKMIY